MAETGMTADTKTREWSYQVRVGSPGELPVSVVMAPQQSVVRLLHQAASGQSAGALPGLLATIRKALRPQARFAAQPLADRGSRVMPESCSPISPLTDTSVAEQAVRLRDMPASTLSDELRQTASNGQPYPPEWRVAGEQPRRWLNSMADASLDTWAVVQPRWQAAGPLLDREVRRVGTAMVRGGMGALLNNLHPRLRYANGALTMDFRCDQRLTLGPRRLTLLPMIADRDTLLVSFERPDVCYIGYPVRQPGPGTRVVADGALAMILGPLRATILQALRQPLTVGQLAAAAQCAPTTATYHLGQLAAAGMIIREQRGTSVRVSRTIRGDELVDLLSD
jgi:DNA-binding transcriptional ArsR family regulator